MWIAIFSSFSHPCEVMHVVMFGVGVDMLTDMESMVGVAYAGDVRAGTLTDLLTIIDVVPAIDVDILTDKNVNGLEAVMTPLEFALPAP